MVGGRQEERGGVGVATLPFLSYGISPLLPPPTHEQRDAALVGHQREREREEAGYEAKDTDRQMEMKIERERGELRRDGGPCVFFFLYDVVVACVGGTQSCYSIL